MEKLCTKCSTPKNIDEFCNRKGTHDGKHRYCRLCIKKENDKWYNETKDSRKEYYKDYRETNKKYYNDYCHNHYHTNKELYRNWERNRLKTDMSFRIKKSVMAILHYHLNKNNEYKTHHTVEYLGCTIEIYRDYLEKLFTSEMNWENYGTYWEIDHIKPIDLFELSNPEELFKCFHYTNTQPMFWKDNRIKSNNLTF
jgi:hypothetical protein